MNNTKPGSGRPALGWMRDARTRSYRKGETIISVGSKMDDWIAISSGATWLETRVAGDVKVAVATLWFGDVLGRSSPLGRSVSEYQVVALTDVETVAISEDVEYDLEATDTAHLYAATATRLNRQIAMRLAGNGPQRLMSVLSTLGHAFAQGHARTHRLQSLAVPIQQSCLARLSGLSRRQVWLYLGELAQAGWLQTSRTQVVLQNLASWQFLQSEIEHKGLTCISTINHSVDTLSRLILRLR